MNTDPVSPAPSGTDQQAPEPGATSRPVGPVADTAAIDSAVSSPGAVSVAKSTAPAPTALPAEDREHVTCPDCGTPATVTLNRRDAVDFCTVCDFPLFWTPSAVIRGTGAGGDDSLRRLPGTAGRQTVASVPCPTCAEANPISAVICLRCGGPMVLPVIAPEPVPEPEPVVVAPTPVVEPKRSFPWWWLVLGLLTLAVLVGLIVAVTR